MERGGVPDPVITMGRGEILSRWPHHQRAVATRPGRPI